MAAVELALILPPIELFPPIHQYARAKELREYADHYAANYFPYGDEEVMNWYIDIDLAAYVYMTIPFAKNHARMQGSLRLHLLYFRIDDLLDKNLIKMDEKTLLAMLPPQGGQEPAIAPESLDPAVLPILKTSSEMWKEVKSQLAPSDYKKVIRPIEAWFRELKLAKGYTNVEELLDLRVNDVAMEIVYACLYYSMELCIPDHEYDSLKVRSCAKTATKICAIVNDLASYMKEVKDDCVENNLVTKLQEWNNCTPLEAKKDLLDRIPKLYEDLYHACELVLGSDMCGDTKKFVAALPYVVSGNTWWHNYSLRYREGRGRFYCQEVKPCVEITPAS